MLADVLIDFGEDCLEGFGVVFIEEHYTRHLLETFDEDSGLFVIEGVDQ